jgi:DNA mismatch endonuclease, patch repair protein
MAAGIADHVCGKRESQKAGMIRLKSLSGIILLIRMDTLTPQERSERMSRVRGRDTKPELLVRQIVHRLGFRYRLHSAELPGKPDLAFIGRRRTIFVHGCFWHQHGGRCALSRLPKSRLSFWKSKLEGNRKRDLRNQRKLRRDGWRVLVLWECQLNDEEKLECRILEFMGRAS